MTAQDIKTLAAKYYDDMLTFRRYLHANPERSFKEEKTAESGRV